MDTKNQPQQPVQNKFPARGSTLFLKTEYKIKAGW
jgi:hypothetical protein